MPLTPAAIMEGMAFAATCFGNKPTKPVFEKVHSIARCLPCYCLTTASSSLDEARLAQMWVAC